MIYQNICLGGQFSADITIHESGREQCPIVQIASDLFVMRAWECIIVEDVQIHPVQEHSAFCCLTRWHEAYIYNWTWSPLSIAARMKPVGIQEWKTELHQMCPYNNRAPLTGYRPCKGISSPRTKIKWVYQVQSVFKINMYSTI